MEHVGGTSRQERAAQEVLDFLYRDLGRIASLYAQLFQGDLLGIATQETTREAKATTIGVSAKVAEWRRQTEADTTQVWSQQIDPHDYKALLLLHALDLAPLDESLDTVETGRLILVKGGIAIRSYGAVKGIFRNLSKEPGMLNLPAGAKLEGMSRAQAKRALPILMECLPGGLELEVLTEKQETLVGALKPEGLSETPEDLLRTRGIALPGTWFVLGIFHHLERDRPVLPRRPLIAELDAVSEGFRNFYSLGLKYIMQPILVFQKVHWGQ